MERHPDCKSECQQAVDYGVWPERSCDPECVWLRRYKRRASELPSLVYLRTLIADDSYAMTFQAMGQYRTALLKAIDAIVQG